MRRALLLALACVFGTAGSAQAALQLSTDNRRLITFGLMRPGETKQLAEQGSYHHQLTCTSTNGRPWYLKVHVLQPLTSGSEIIPFERFQWQLVGTNGTGTTPTLYQLVPLTPAPTLIYVSGANEASGQAITFQLKYVLSIPTHQVSGSYYTTLRFTLTEIL